MLEEQPICVYECGNSKELESFTTLDDHLQPDHMPIDSNEMLVT